MEYIKVAIIDDAGPTFIDTVERVLQSVSAAINHTEGYQLNVNGKRYRVKFDDPTGIADWDAAKEVVSTDSFDLVLLDIIYNDFLDDDQGDDAKKGFEILNNIRERDREVGTKTEVIMISSRMGIGENYIELSGKRYEPFNILDFYPAGYFHEFKLDSPAEFANKTPQGKFLVNIVKRACENIIKERELKWKEKRLSHLEMSQESDPLDAIIGSSEQILKLKDTIKNKIAQKDITVLITGESGTGKELVAQAIHYTSDRKEKEPESINVAAYTESILQSELFGHEKGAFTSATEMKKGVFELADESTLFLDEIGEMPYEMQKNLLRILVTKEFKRVGGTKNIKVDFRLITTTNRDLMEAIGQKEFREDLYYRIKVMNLIVPTLRERISDIPLLIDHFINKYNDEYNLNIVGVATDAKDVLLNYQWPGNVRELKNVIQSAMAYAESEKIEVCNLPSEILDNSKAPSQKPNISKLGNIGTPPEEKIKFPDWFEKLEDSRLANRLKILADLQTCEEEHDKKHLDKLKHCIFTNIKTNDGRTVYDIFLEVKKNNDTSDKLQASTIKQKLKISGDKDTVNRFFTSIVTLVLLSEYENKMNEAEYKKYVATIAEKYFGYSGANSQAKISGLLTPIEKLIKFKNEKGKLLQCPTEYKEVNGKIEYIKTPRRGSKCNLFLLYYDTFRNIAEREVQ